MPAGRPPAARRDTEATPLSVLRLASVFEPARLAPAAYDPVGGMQTHTAELTRRLDRIGVRQTVLTSRLAGAAGRTRSGEHAVVVRTGLHLPALRQLWAVPALAAALHAPGPFDVVHAHAGEDLAVLPIARLAAARHGSALVVTLHCSLAHTFRDRSARGVLLRLVGGAAERRAVAAAAAVIALTPSAARLIRAAGVPADRVHVIPSGFDPDLFAADGPDPFPDVPRPRVAYVGRLARQKGVDVLLEAFARCERRATLLVVGDGPERAALERRARRLRRDVRFTGFLPHRRIPAVLLHVDVLVLPSRFEELGSVLVEAMATGLPVVASRVGGIPDLIRDGHDGLLVEPEDPDALARAVDRLLADPHTAVRLGAAARVTAGAYAWPALAEQVAELYRRVAAGHAAEESA